MKSEHYDARIQYFCIKWGPDINSVRFVCVMEQGASGIVVSETGLRRCAMPGLAWALLNRRVMSR